MTPPKKDKKKVGFKGEGFNSLPPPPPKDQEKVLKEQQTLATLVEIGGADESRDLGSPKLSERQGAGEGGVRGMLLFPCSHPEPTWDSRHLPALGEGGRKPA